MNYLISHFRTIVLGLAGLMLMVLVTACAGVAGVAAPTVGSPSTVTGIIQSVDVAKGSVTITINGTSKTINGLSTQQATALQSQVGKTYKFTATANADGTYSISNGSNGSIPVVAAPGTPEGIETPSSNETPSATEPAGPAQAGSISFIGKVQSVTSSSIVVSLPGGSTLSTSINAQTDKSSFNGALPSVGQTIKVDATANADGSFTATQLKPTDQGDLNDQVKLNTVDFKGVTTSAVGSDRVLHFKVGSKSYSYAIVSTTDLGDFNGNAQGIQTNQAVKVEVLFNGSTGTVVKVKNSNG